MAGGFAAIAFLLLVLPNPYRQGLASGIRGSVLLPIVALQGGAVDREERFTDARLLRAERDSLAAFLVGQADVTAENRELRGILGMRPRLPYSFVPAEVVRMRGPANQGMFLLTAGSAEGLRAGAPIVTAQGLVGTVRTVDLHTAIGIDWTHPDFRASAVSLDGETYGIVEPRNVDGGERLLALTSTALHTVPEPGTVVVTSGAGGYYPRGIPLGTVVRPERNSGSWQRVYLVRPTVGRAEMSHVLVLGERSARTTDQDLASAWGIRLTDATFPDSVVVPVAASPPTTPVSAPPQAAPPRPRGIVRPERADGPPLLGTPVERPPVDGTRR